MDLLVEGEDIELVGSCSYVPLCVPVTPHHSEHVGNQHVVANVELSVVVEEGSVNVQLDDEGFSGSILVLLFLVEHVVDLIQFVDHCDPVASVGEFSWLHNPNVPEPLLLLPGLIFFILTLRLILFSLLILFLLLGDIRCPLLVVHLEPLVLDVVGPVPDVECQGQIVEHIIVHQLVVLLQVVEHCLFVAQEEIVLQVVVNQEPMVVGQLNTWLLDVFVPVLHGLRDFLLSGLIFLQILLHQSLVFCSQYPMQILEVETLCFFPIPLSQNRLGPLLLIIITLLFLLAPPELSCSSLDLGWLLPVEHLWHLQLCPYKVKFFQVPLLDNVPPEPPFDKTLYKHPVISSSDPYLVLVLVFEIQPSVHGIQVSLLRFQLVIDVHVVGHLDREDELPVYPHPPLVDLVPFAAKREIELRDFVVEVIVLRSIPQGLGLLLYNYGRFSAGLIIGSILILIIVIIIPQNQLGLVVGLVYLKDGRGVFVPDHVGHDCCLCVPVLMRGLGLYFLDLQSQQIHRSIPIFLFRILHA